MEAELGLIEILEKVPEELKAPFKELFKLINREIGERLTKKDFEAFEKRFEAFAERTEENFRRLFEAQRKTEEHLNELAEAQKRTEERLGYLEKVVAELAEAQKRTEERLSAFEKQTEENFNRVWKAINELAEAQKRTEEEIRQLTARMDQFERRLEKVEDRLEGLSDTVGYTLENRAYKALPEILTRYGIEVKDRLLRRYVRVGKKERQLNIYGYGRRNGEKVLILGEAKVRPSKKEISRFEKLCRALEEQEGLPVFRLFVAHDFPPAIEEDLHRRGILPVWSYDLE